MCRVTIAALIGLGACSLAAENALTNGDFERKKIGWDTDTGMRVIGVTEKLVLPGQPTSNRMLQAEIHKSRTRILQQDFRVKKTTKALRILFRIKASDDYECAAPSAGHYIIRCRRADGSSTYTPRTLDKTGEWENVEWTFTEVGNSRRFQFSLEFKPGKGSIFVDDISVCELDK